MPPENRGATARNAGRRSMKGKTKGKTPAQKGARATPPSQSDDPVVTVTRRKRDQDRCEQHLVEFIGGPFDGAFLHLDIVRESATVFRVLETAYQRTYKSRKTILEMEEEVRAHE
jgi:hypothetical protein